MPFLLDGACESAAWVTTPHRPEVKRACKMEVEGPRITMYLTCPFSTGLG
jgi:NAD(P)H-hydrate repair Nnr-like enzyme with NAD(P)H-hydrate dehydratase domain